MEHVEWTSAEGPGQDSVSDVWSSEQQHVDAPSPDHHEATMTVRCAGNATTQETRQGNEVGKRGREETASRRGRERPCGRGVGGRREMGLE